MHSQTSLNPFQIHDVFQQRIGEFSQDIFKTISETIEFEQLAPGRKSAILVHKDIRGVPLVRTTCISQNPSYIMTPIMYDIMAEIKRVYGDHCVFNNAWVETYDTYKSMSFHSDQSLDLDKNSYICVCSWYSDEMTSRSLVVVSKTNNENLEIPLAHNSMVLFSVADNDKYEHRIIKSRIPKRISSNRWLGITFRLSRTFINWDDTNRPFIGTTIPFYLADETEKIEFLKMRGMENRSIGFDYPEIYYTISPGDLIPL